MKAIMNYLFGVVVAVLLTLTRIWQLVIIAAVVSGFLLESNKARKNELMGILVIVTAWAGFIIYFLLTQPALLLMDMVFVLIIGSDGLGFLAIILTLLIAALMGMSGGLFGFAINQLIKNNVHKSE